MRFVIFLALASFMTYEAYAAACGTVQTCSSCVNPAPICWDCNDGWERTADKKECVQCSDHCEECTITSQQTKTTACTDCEDHWILKTKGTGKDTCMECASLGCKECLFKDNNTQAETECSECYEKLTSTYYILSSKKECLSCSSHCTACSENTDTTSTTCTACGDGYYVKDGACTSCPSNCKTCSEVSGTAVCSKCNDRYELNVATDGTKTCLACPTACTKFSTEDNGGVAACTECKDGYYKETNACVDCDNVDSNCDKCAASDKCDLCDKKYYTESEGTCTWCDWKCEECTKDANDAYPCTKCDEFYGVKDSKHYSCDVCISNCAICDTNGKDGKCDTCKSGYVTDSDGKCKKCPNNCNDCTWKSSDSKTWCKSGDCISDYVVRSDNGECEQCPDRCTSCSWNSGQTKSYCSACSDDTPNHKPYAAGNGECHACQTYCSSTSSHCSYNTTMSHTDCDQCESGYNFNGDYQCTECNHCSACSWNDTMNAMECTSGTCDDGYRFEFDSTAGIDVCTACPSGGNCLTCNETVCITCPSKTTLSDDMATCDDCMAHCSSCDYESGTLKCGSGNCYTPDTADNKNYTTNTDRTECIVCPTNCEDCEYKTVSHLSDAYKQVCKSGKCVDGYARITDTSKSKKTKYGECEKCPSFCHTCTFDTSLTTPKTKCSSGQCYTGYALATDGSCKSCNPDGAGCTACNYDETAASNNIKCTTCQTNYYTLKTDAERCTPCAENCYTCSHDDTGALQCDVCVSYYGLKNGVCTRCPNNCLTCEVPSEQTELQCTDCVSKYYKNTEKCGACPTNCIECDDDIGSMKCKTCKDGYILDTKDGVCYVCPSGCSECTVTSGKTFCKLGKCSSGLARNTDGSECSSCSDLTGDANCNSCTDADSAGKSKIISCITDYAIQDMDGFEGCVSTTSLTNCPQWWRVDPPMGCESQDKCTDGTTYRETGDKGHKHAGSCFLECAVCGDPMTGDFKPASECQKESGNYTTDYCPNGACFAVYMKVGAVETYARGCMNQTCTTVDSESCEEANGEKKCVVCCKGENCNADLTLTGQNSGAVAVTGGLLALLFASLITYFNN